MIEQPVSLSGTVKRYSGNGRQLGYPTANIATETNLADGIYLGYADLADYEQQPTLIFIGTPETVGDTERRVEAHLLDIIDQDYYGQTLRLNVRKFLRPSEKFKSVEELIARIKADETVGREWFAKGEA